MRMSERIARLEHDLPRVTRELRFPKFDNVAGSDAIALCAALEDGYWLNLLERPAFAEMFKGERITSTQGALFGTLCPEVMASEQPMSKPWRNPARY